MTPLAEIQVGSQEWFDWLSRNSVFIVDGPACRYTARREQRRGHAYWYAYRRHEGKLAKAYLGKADELTSERLDDVRALLAGENLLERLATEAGTLSGPNLEPAAGLSFSAQSKMGAPAMPQYLVRRPRLSQRISGAITLIYAPSGYGKSTLINEWSQTCGRPVAWVTLDPEDNQPLRFWSTIVAALQCLPGLEQVLRPHLRIASASEVSESLAQMSHEIGKLASLPGGGLHFGLVLDDYHHTQHPKINAAMQAWLEQTLPPNLQLIISGHTRPRLALGHLRAKQHITELETEDLRFTFGEGIDFLWQYTREQPLAYGEMEALVQRTEGWAAGLSLATLALSKHLDRHQFLEHFNGNHEYLSEYFMESVISRQPPAVQSFLLKTSILKHLTGELCEAVTGQADGTATLARLWNQNLFIVRSAQQDWYRYHDLFAETLRGHLQRRFPAEIPNLHRRAAEWYCAQSAPADAVFHLLAIQAWEEAAALIDKMAQLELEQFGEDSRLLSWLLQLPESVVQRHISLLSVYIRLAVMALSSQEAERILARAEADLAGQPAAEQTSDEQAVLAQIRVLRWAWASDQLLAVQLLKGSPNDDLWQMLVEVVQYDNVWGQDLEEATRLAGQLYEAAQARRHVFLMLMAGGAWAGRLAAQGQLRRCEKIAQRVLRQVLAQRGRLPEPASITLTALGRVYYERYQLQQAEQFALRATEVDPNPTSSNQPIAIAILRARIQSAQGHADAALATLAAARALHARHPARIYRERDLIAYQALVYARHGQPDRAEQLVTETGERDSHPLVGYVWAESLLQQGRWAEAETILRQLLEIHPDGFYDQPGHGIAVMLAVVLYEQQKLNLAQSVMADTLRRAAPECFVRPFLDCGARCIPVLALVKHNERLTTEAQAFLKSVLRLIGETVGVPTALPSQTLQALTTAASISAHEQAVLRLAGTGLSVKKIASALSVSTSTVKTHLANIYRKLEVRNRTQAILKAQALALI